MQKISYNNIGKTLISETLPNGLKINIVPKPDYSKSVAFFAANYGGADRRFKLSGNWTDTPAGVAHFLEHKLFDMPDGNALNVMSETGASPNAFTSSKMTAYYFECTDGFNTNLDTLLNFVSTPYFTDEGVQKEQGIIGQEIHMIEDDPGFVVYYNLLRCLYTSNPIRESVAGTVGSIAEITRETLYDCHKVFYNPSNMTLSVVGNVNPESVIEMAKKILPSEPGEIPQRDYGPDESEIPHEREKSVSMEVSAPQFLFGAKFKPEKSGVARLKQMLTADIALRMVFGRSSDFYTRLYAEGLLNNSFSYDHDFAAGTAMIMVGGESRDVSAVTAELKNELSRISAQGIGKERFEAAKKALFGISIKSLDSFSYIARSLAVGAFTGFCPFDSFGLFQEINLDDVLNFITGNLTKDKIALSVVSPLTA